MGDASPALNTPCLVAAREDHMGISERASPIEEYVVELATRQRRPVWEEEGHKKVRPFEESKREANKKLSRAMT